MGRILAVVSHPDDEAFGCGGTLAHQTAQGDHVKVLCLTCNPRRRKEELLVACHALGVLEPTIFEEDYVKHSKELMSRVADLIVAEKPQIVITHIPFDYHTDHVAAYEIVKEAIEWAAHTTTYSKPWHVEHLLLMEINTLIPTPHVLVNITTVMERKMAAVEQYKSQLAKFPWNYYQSFTVKKAELRGTQADCPFAEAFLEEPIPKNGPFYEVKATKNLLR